MLPLLGGRNILSSPSGPKVQSPELRAPAYAQHPESHTDHPMNSTPLQRMTPSSLSLSLFQQSPAATAHKTRAYPPARNTMAGVGFRLAVVLRETHCLGLWKEKKQALMFTAPQAPAHHRKSICSLLNC